MLSGFKMNPMASEFTPQSVINENEMFDKLERKFVAENRFIFDADEDIDMILKTCNTPFEQVRGPRYILKKKFKQQFAKIDEEKSWAKIVSNQ